MLEGCFWLALVTGAAFPAPAHMALATDVYNEGWLIVPVKWSQAGGQGAARLQAGGQGAALHCGQRYDQAGWAAL